MNKPPSHRVPLFLVLIAAGLLAGCAWGPKPGTAAKRHGDEIMVAGRMFRIGTPVVLWFDKGGYDAYRVEARFKPLGESGWDDIKEKVREPNRYSWRVDRFNNGRADFTDEQIAEVRDGWTLEQLQGVVDQFVLHYDVCGTSAYCFEVLHDHRCLSIHFMLDVDGTIYQTLDLKERAWHASTANSRSVGIEIANIGAYGPDDKKPFDAWYETDDDGRAFVTIPESRGGDNSQRRPGRYYVAEPVVATGTINGNELEHYNLTETQYKALVKLTAALVEVFPRIENRYPTDADGNLITRELTDEEFAEFNGVIGHFHETTRKVDPGPAFDWERLQREVDKQQRRWF